MADKTENEKNQGESAEPSESPRGKNALEWTIFGASLLLVLSLLSFLGLQALRSAALPPRLEVSLGEPVKAGDRVLVPVTVENKGDMTASGVEVEVQRRNSDEAVNFSLPYVPRRGHRKGWATFDAPLNKRELEAAVLGYEES